MAFKFGNVVLCDNVYFDQESKKSVLAGVYTGDIVFPTFPATVRLALLIECVPDRNGDIELDLQFVIDGKHNGGAKVGISAVKTGTASMVIPAFELQFSKPTVFQVKAVVPGEKPRILLKKRVLLA